MAEFTVNTSRFDPYKDFKFRLRWDGKDVAGVSSVSALKRTTEPVTHRDGGDPNASRTSPSTWSFDPITVQRGVTHDPEFEAWANLIYSAEGDAAFSLANFRKDITIQLLNEQGTVAKAYTVYRCWVSEYQALPDMDANGTGVAIESMVLQNEGWERDTAVPEPTES